MEALDAASNREDLERLLDEAFDAGLGPDCDEFLQVFVDMVEFARACLAWLDLGSHN